MLDSPMTVHAAKQLNPLILAYVGDAAFELHVRAWLITQGCERIDQLHKSAVARVQATAQAKAARLLVDELLPEEADIFRRGKNAKPIRLPKSASLADYRFSTGLEAVVGYLKLTGQEERLNWLMFHILTAEEPENHPE